MGKHDKFGRSTVNLSRGVADCVSFLCPNTGSKPKQANFQTQKNGKYRKWLFIAK